MSDSAREQITDLVENWLRAGPDEITSARRRLNSRLGEHTSIRVPLALIRDGDATDPSLLEWLTLWFIEPAQGDQNTNDEPAPVVPLHPKGEADGIVDAVEEAVHEAIRSYARETDAEHTRALAVVVFVVGEAIDDASTSVGNLDGRSGQAAVCFATLSWLADRNPPAVLCIGPCNPALHTLTNTLEKVQLAVRGDWDQCVLPRSAATPAFSSGLRDAGWANSDAGDTYVNQESGQQIALYKYHDAEELYDLWRRLCGISPDVDLGYFPVPNPEKSEVPTMGDLWRAALEVGTSNRRRPVPAHRVTKLLRNLHYSGATTDLMVLNELQKEVWRRATCSHSDVDANPFDSRRHLLVAGPTGCGKTTLAEIIMICATLQAKKQKAVLYVAPTKALTQAFYRNLVSKYGQADLLPNSPHGGIILSTGEDVADDWRFRRGSFAIACLVYEKANVLASVASELLGNLSMVVIDETHMLTNGERGPLLDTFLAKIQHERARRERTESDDDPIRIVALSTEAPNSEPDAGLMKLLTYRDLDKFEDAPPLHVCTATRPLPILHTLILPARDRAISPYRLVDIKLFAGDDARVLSGSEIDELDRVISGHELTVRPSNTTRFDVRTNSRQEAHARLLALIKDIVTENPTGRRVLVFVSSINDVLDLAARTRNLLAKTLPSIEDRPVQHSFAGMEDEVEDDHLLNDVSRWAAQGVFVHYSTLEGSVRQRVEDWCAGQPQGATEVLFSTQTLAFGVNLWITDVIILGTEFYSASRTRGEVGKPEPLELYEFHNMVGRAGRPGKSSEAHPPCVYVIPWDRQDAVKDILQRYYGSVTGISSKIFLKPEKALLEDADFNTIQAEEFSHPFLRAVLDGLRHSSFISNKHRANDIASVGVSQEQLMTFFEGTLFGRLCGPLRPRLNEGAEGQLNIEAALFRRCVKLALESCSNLSNSDSERARIRLVKVIPGQTPLYSITEEGQAIIDTGVEVRTIVPLLKLVDEIWGVWDASPFNDVAFPTELYLLCILAQFEAHDPVISDLPEFNGDAKTWTQNYQLLNAKLVTAELAGNLSKMIGAQASERSAEVARLARDLVAAVSNHPTVPELAERHAPHALYPIGAAHSFIRLFNAVYGWMDGRPPAESRLSVTRTPPGQKISARFPRRFSAYAELLSWKVECLSRLLAARLGDSEGELAALGDGSVELLRSLSRRSVRLTEQVSLKNMVWRLRLGCRADAIPMLVRRSGEILRRDASTVITAGITSADILRSSDALAEVSGLSKPTTKGAIRRELQSHMVNQFRALAEAFSAGSTSDPKPEELAAVGLWQWLSSSGYPTSVEQFRLPQRGQDLVSRVWNSLTAAIHIDSADEVGGRGDQAIPLSTNTSNGQQHTTKLERQDLANPGLYLSSGSPLAPNARIVFIASRSDSFGQVSFPVWEPIADILDREDPNAGLVIVFCPWPSNAAICDPLLQAIQSNRRENARTVVCSLAAFSASVSCLARNLVNPEKLLQGLAGPEAELLFDIPALLRIVEDATSFPNPLLEALIRYAHSEVCVPLEEPQD